MKLTNYYLHQSDQQLRLEKVVLQLRGRPKKLDRTDSSSEDIRILPGIADSSRLNRQYKELLVNLKVDQMDNRTISNECHLRYFNHSDNDDVHIHDSSHSRDTRNRNTSESLTIPTTTQDIIIYLRIMSGWSILSLCSKFWVTKQEISHIFNKFK